MESIRIDVHTHILPKELPKWKKSFGYGGFIELDHHKPCCARMIKDDGTFFREVEENLWSPEKRIEQCDQNKVHVQVLSTVPVMFHYWAHPQDALETSRFLNDQISETVQKYPKRFLGLGTVPLQDPELAIGELQRCMSEGGLKGVQIGTHVNDWNLSAPELFSFFQEAEKLDAAIFIHPWDMMNAIKMQKYWLPWLVGMPAELSLAMCSLIFSGVLEKCPKLKICFAHGGGAFPGTLARIDHGFHARPDLCAVDNPHPPSYYLKKFFVDSLVHDERTLKFIIDIFGEDHICLGTDYPFPLGEDIPGSLIQTHKDFSNEIKNKLYSKNAMRWLGVHEKQFI